MPLSAQNGDAYLGDDARERFQDAFAAVWQGDAENDNFNTLVLGAGLTWRQAVVLRAYAKYLRQAGSTFSQDYMEDTLRTNVHTTRLLVSLFEARMSPARQTAGSELVDAMLEELDGALDQVASLDEDRILRAFLTLIKATLRTNFFQLNDAGEQHAYVSMKFDPQAIPDLGAPPGLRDLGVLAARRRRPPALRQGRPRRSALVRPARGLPYGDPRPGQGADGQEHRHRAGRRQGRLRRQEPARPVGGPRRLARRGHRLVQDLHLGAARHHRQHGRRRGRAADRRGAPRRGRHLPRRRRRQGHRDLLRHRQRGRGGVRVLAR